MLLPVDNKNLSVIQASYLSIEKQRTLRRTANEPNTQDRHFRLRVRRPPLDLGSFIVNPVL